MEHKHVDVVEILELMEEITASLDYLEESFTEALSRETSTLWNNQNQLIHSAWTLIERTEEQWGDMKRNRDTLNTSKESGKRNVRLRVKPELGY